MATKTFIGLQYPLKKTSRGLMAQKQGINQVKSDLLQLLLTNPGERVMLPEFGTPLRELFFEPNDKDLELEAKNMIAESINTWEPRIEIKNIDVTSNFDPDNLNTDDPKYDLGHILGIQIEFYDPEDITELQELVLELPLAGS